MTHRELQAVLHRIDSAVGASEAHGWLCGALCVREGFGAAEWLAGLADDADGVAAAGELPAFTELHAETLESLRSEEFGFAPVLPEDDAPLAERVAALAQWCGGFLYGVGAAGAERGGARNPARSARSWATWRISPAPNWSPTAAAMPARRITRNSGVRARRGAARLGGTGRSAPDRDAEGRPLSPARRRTNSRGAGAS